MQKLPLLIAGLIIFFLIDGVANSKLMAQTDPLSSELVSNADITDGHRRRMVPLADLLTILEQNFEVTFLFKDEAVQHKWLHTDKIRIGNNTGQQLAEILDQLGLTYYQVDEQTYVLLPKENLPKKIAIQEQISGTVTDAQSGEMLPGVNILVKGTSIGASTDANGQYELEVESLQDTLMVSFVGYQTQNVPINGRTTINIALQSQAVQGEEMVVVGYGTQQKSDITGSMSSVTADELSQGAATVTSVDQLLKGKAAGVRVVQNSSEPGGGTSISIRGAGSINAGTGPLYVIDGLPIDNSPPISSNGAGVSDTRTPPNPLNTINPTNIESIEILKDASATAIYGSRGANGVILITTKQGNKGNLRINYNGKVGIEKQANKLNLLSANEYKQVLNQIISEGGGSADQKVDRTHSTNWQKALEQKNAMYTNHNLSFSGGDNATTYFGSINYLSQNGTVINSSIERYSARLNLNSNLAKAFHVGMDISTSYVNDDIVAHGAEGNENAGALYAAYNYDPTIPIRDSDGNFNRSPFITIDNPRGIATGSSLTQNSYRTYGKAYAQYDILPAFSIKAKAGGDFLEAKKRIYVDRSTLKGRGAGGIATQLESDRSNYLFEGTIHYNQNFQGIHKLDALLGITTQRFINKNMNGHISGFSSDQTRAYNLSLGNTNRAQLNSGYSSYRLLSYIGRANYTFMDKYLVTGTLRIDGSSRFGANNRFGYYPSGALGWRIKKEKFMKNIGVISKMKIRGSWGQTGNQDIPNNVALSTFGSGGNVTLDEKPVPATAPTRLANPDLKWETTEQWDIGLDFGLFGGRVSGNIDYYQKRTFDMLVRLPIPSSTGFNSQLRNVGRMKNKGIDFTLNTKNLNNKNFQWSSTVNLATLHNEVISLGGISEIITGSAHFASNVGIIKPGKTLRSFYGYKIDGVWQKDDDYSNVSDNIQSGDLKYRDVNKDGKIGGDDRVILGNSFPDLTWSLGNTFSYKNYELYVFLEGQQGVSMFNAFLSDSYYPINFRRNKFAVPYLNRWTPDHPSNKYPSFVHPLSQGRNAVNSYTVEDASYLRLKTIRLTYHLPVQLFGNTMRNASVFIMGENIATITNYSGLDPAINTNGDANFRMDINTYPLSRSFLIGVNLGF